MRRSFISKPLLSGCKDTAFISKSQIADVELTFIVGDLTFTVGELTFIDGELTLAPRKNEARLRQSIRKVTAKYKKGALGSSACYPLNLWSLTSHLSFLPLSPPTVADSQQCPNGQFTRINTIPFGHRAVAEGHRGGDKVIGLRKACTTFSLIPQTFPLFFPRIRKKQLKSPPIGKFLIKKKSV